jgi:hypothetical protein
LLAFAGVAVVDSLRIFRDSFTGRTVDAGPSRGNDTRAAIPFATLSCLFTFWRKEFFATLQGIML